MKEKGKVRIIGEAQLQPNDKNTEFTVLATLMAYNERFTEFSDKLNVELFYDEINKCIYECIAGVISEGYIADVNSLSNYAKTHDLKYKLESFDFLDLVKFVSNYTIEQDIERLRRMWKQRKLWFHLQLASQNVLDPMNNFDEVINETMNILGDIQSDTADNGIYSFDESVKE